MNRTSRVWLPMFALVLFSAMFTLVVFSAGITTGVISMQVYRTLQRPASAQDRRPPMPSPRQLTTLLTDELQLTTPQQEQLAAILTARRHKFAALREQVREQFERDAGDLADDIQQILTPKQRKQFDGFVSRVRAKFLEAGSAGLHPAPGSPSGIKPSPPGS